MNYRRLSATLGQLVRVELAGETFTGKAVEVTGDGSRRVSRLPIGEWRTVG